MIEAQQYYFDLLPDGRLEIASGLAYSDRYIEYLRRCQTDDPVEMLRKELDQGKRRLLLIVGNIHETESHQDVYRKIILDLGSRFDFLAIEVGFCYKDIIESWSKGRPAKVGKEERLRPLKAGYQLWRVGLTRDILTLAGENELEILCVDQPMDDDYEVLRERDRLMAERLANYLQSFPQSRGVFFVGNNHALKKESSTALLLSNLFSEEIYTVQQLGPDEPFWENEATLFRAINQLGVQESLGLSRSNGMGRKGLFLFTDAFIIHPSGKE